MDIITLGAALKASKKYTDEQIATLEQALEYKGSWNAQTNVSPTLADGTGNTGDIYIVSVGGSQDLGSGEITFQEGDWVIYNGSVWELSINLIMDANHIPYDNTTSALIAEFVQGAIDEIDEKIESRPADLVFNNVYFVSKQGVDTNDGTSQNEPFLTITKALSEAGSNGLLYTMVNVLDSEEYEEDFTVPSKVFLDASKATIKGFVILRGGSRFHVNRHLAKGNTTTLLAKMDAEHSYYNAVLSSSNSFTGVTNIRNSTNNSILFANVQYLITSFRGIQDFSGATGEGTTGGHIHFDVKDLYLAGNHARGLDISSASSDFVGKIDHIRVMGTPTSLVGIQIGNESAMCNVVIGAIELSAHTAYNNTAGGEFNLNCLKIEGTQIGDAILPTNNEDFASHTAQDVTNGDDPHGIESAEEDLRFPFTPATKGNKDTPAFDETNVGLIFPENDETHRLFIVAQLPHAYKPDSAIQPHVHFRQDQAGQPIFKMEYKWYNPRGSDIPSTWETYLMDTNTVTWTSGTISNMIYGTGIDGTGKRESSILLIKLYRQTGDGYVGNVLADEFDIHFVAEKFGKTFPTGD